MKKVLEIDLQDNGVAAVFCDIGSDREMSRLSAVMLALGYECEEFAIAMFAAADTLRVNREAVGEAIESEKKSIPIAFGGNSTKS